MTVRSRDTILQAWWKHLDPVSFAFPWIVLFAAGATAFYWDGFISLGAAWSRPEYSYGPLVPFVTAYLVLREIQHQPVRPDHGSRLVGLAAIFLALLVGLLGNLARIPDIITYGFIILVGGVVLLVAGTREGARFWPGWLHLIFMLPLPQFIYLSASTKLQLISSRLGVWFIQLANVPVFLDGNVIDLGDYKLQVAEACSGLRYLFPLFSFGWLIAVLYRGPRWHKVVIFLSTVPITILMNSFRIGLIGVLVNYFGTAQAEGFLHFFEGWVIFIACTLLLYLEAWLLQRFASGGPAPSSVLSLDFSGMFEPLRKLTTIPGNPALMIASIIVLAVGLTYQFYPVAPGAQAARQPLALFPLQVGSRLGTQETLDAATASVLGADDYLLATYGAGAESVNLFLAFYNSQTEGAGMHSPEICIPTGGWEVSQWTQAKVKLGGDGVAEVNRAVIQKGLQRQLVYYWFEERGRQTTNDYNAKFLSIWDTITSGRSDGGVVRLVTSIDARESVAAADARLVAFMREIVPELPPYFPPLWQ